MISLSEFPYVVIDVETTGLSWPSDKTTLIAVWTPNGKFVVNPTDSAELSALKEEAKRVKLLVNHNVKFDLHFLKAMGVEFLCPVFDTMVMAALLDEHEYSYSLDAIATKYLGESKDSSIYEVLAEMYGGKANRATQAKRLHLAPWDTLAKYALQDVTVTASLFQALMPMIHEQGLKPLLDLEMKLLLALFRMEHHGVTIDSDAAVRSVDLLGSAIDSKQRELNNLAGFPVNPNPSGSIKKLFEPKLVDGKWVLIDGTVANVTESGAASIDAECLQRMNHPAAKLILSLRRLVRTKVTTLQDHILGNLHNGKIHANYNQTKSDNDKGTETGRLSCNNPNLQQIHKRHPDTAEIVRSVFLPDDPQSVWASMDWSQMDFRVFCHYCENEDMLRKYRENPEIDFHQMVADLTGLPRTKKDGIKGNAKQINLGLVFGMGEGTLAEEMGLPFELKSGKGKSYKIPGPEAQEVFEMYHQNVPGIKALLQRAASVAKSRGYVKTALGRRIRFPNGQAVHKAGGLIFQGTAADALKQKIVEVDDFLSSSGHGALLLNVHDELDMSLNDPGKLDKVVPEIKRIYECFDGAKCPIKFNVPIRSSCGVGPNWWIASKG